MFVQYLFYRFKVYRNIYFLIDIEGYISFNIYELIIYLYKQLKNSLSEILIDKFWLFSQKVDLQKRRKKTNFINILNQY